MRNASTFYILHLCGNVANIMPLFGSGIVYLCRLKLKNMPANQFGRYTWLDVFLQLIVQQGDHVEVLEPTSLRDQMRNLAKTLTSYYKD